MIRAEAVRAGADLLGDRVLRSKGGSPGSRTDSARSLRGRRHSRLH